MGIEIPEEYGGQGGSFFQCVMAVEELSAVDPSAGVIVDVQNTIVNNAIMRWANADQKQRYLPRLAADTVASYALSEAGSGSDAFAMATQAAGLRRSFSAQRPQALDHQRGRSPGSSCSSPTPIPRPVIAASRRFWSSASFPASRSARRRTSSACARPPPAS